VLALMIDIYMGMRLSDIEQVEVGDFMFASGKLRQEVPPRGGGLRVEEVILADAQWHLDS